MGLIIPALSQRPDMGFSLMVAVHSNDDLNIMTGEIAIVRLLNSLMKWEECWLKE